MERHLTNFNSNVAWKTSRAKPVIGQEWRQKIWFVNVIHVWALNSQSKKIPIENNFLTWNNHFNLILFSNIYFIRNVSRIQSFPSQSRLRSVFVFPFPFPVPCSKSNVVPGSTSYDIKETCGAVSDNSFIYFST